MTNSKGNKYLHYFGNQDQSYHYDTNAGKLGFKISIIHL